MKYLFSFLLVIAALTGKSQDANSSKNNEDANKGVLTVGANENDFDNGSERQLKEGIENDNLAVPDSKTEFQKTSDKKNQKQATRKYRRGNDTRRIVIIVVVAVVAIAVIAYLLGGAGISGR